MKALIVTDMQKEFINKVYNKNKLIRNVIKLIDYFQRNNQLIIFTQEYHTSKKDKEFRKWGKHCLEGTNGVKIINEITNYEHVLVRKKRYSAFFHTRLNRLLRKNKVKEIFITGVFTDYCILGTSLSAYYNNYDVNVISDATSTYNLKEQKESLELISELTAKIITTNQFLKSNSGGE